MHAEAYEFVRQAVEGHGPFRRVFEIGGRDVNGSVRPLFGAGVDYYSIDLRDGPGVDVVADAASLDPLTVPDCVVCCEVLEHAENAEALVRAACRWLEPGGTFIMTCAGWGRAPHSAVRGELLIMPYQEYYANVSESAFRAWAHMFSEVFTEVDEAHHDLYAVCVR